MPHPSHRGQADLAASGAYRDDAWWLSTLVAYEQRSSPPLGSSGHRGLRAWVTCCGRPRGCRLRANDAVALLLGNGERCWRYGSGRSWPAAHAPRPRWGWSPTLGHLLAIIDQEGDSPCLRPQSLQEAGASGSSGWSGTPPSRVCSWA